MGWFYKRSILIQASACPSYWVLDLFSSAGFARCWWTVHRFVGEPSLSLSAWIYVHECSSPAFRYWSSHWIQSQVCGCSSKKAGTRHDLGFEALHLLFTVRRQVPRLVRKRGGHIGSSQQEDKEIWCPPEPNCIDEYLGNQTVQEECGESVECLIRDMMELKLFPKLERRRRHLNQANSNFNCLVLFVGAIIL